MSPGHHIDTRGKQTVARLLDLVAIPSVNPPGKHYREAVEKLQHWCQSIGMKTAIHRVPDRVVRAAGVDPEYPRYNLIARWDVGAARTIHFNAHYDVVPASGRWRFGGAFEPSVQKGWLYGRGAGDMKGSIAALLAAVEAVKASGQPPAFNIECSLTADEETGGALGAGHIVSEGMVKADYAVVCEGAAGTRIGCGHNGVLWLDVQVIGKPAHAASPQAGVNAFEMMAELVHRLQSYKKRLASTSRMYTDFNGDTRSPTASIGGVFGGHGQKVNTVPGNASFSIDRRVLPNERIASVEAELRKTIGVASAGVDGIKVEVKTLLRIEPCVVDNEHPLPTAFAASLKAVRRRPASFRLTTGFTDLHYFVAGGLPGIGYGVDGRMGHGIDERVRVSDMLLTAKTYAHFMMRGVDG
jgi:succinyl-diaminopimelate desuccinylase